MRRRFVVDPSAISKETRFASKALIDREDGSQRNRRFNHPESVFAGNYNSVTPPNWPSLILQPTPGRRLAARG